MIAASEKIDVAVRQNVDVSKVTASIFYLALILLSAVTPLLVGNQLVTGTVVNFVLIAAARNISDFRKIAPFIVLPSILTMLWGYIFGPFSIMLAYFMPFIWAGNAILVAIFRSQVFVAKVGFFVTLVIAAAMKVGFLFMSASALAKAGLIPALVVNVMSLPQLFTAICGGLIAYLTTCAYRKLFSASR